MMRFLPYIGAILAILAAVAYIDHKGYQRAKQAAELERAQDAIVALNLQRTITAGLAVAVSKVDTQTAAALGNIDVTSRTIIQPTIRREIVKNSRYSNPESGISQEIMDAINQARLLSAPSAELSIPLDEPQHNQ
jgi:hypothetical protein